jgi:YbbR domain-containing protein
MIKSLRNLVLKDFWLKLFSLALAVLIWFTVSFAIQKEVSPTGDLALNLNQITFYNVPVVVLSSASDVHGFNVAPKEVEVTVQGRADILQKLSSRDIRAMVDLTGVETAEDLRKKIDVSTPAGVTHVRVSPTEVKVIFPKPDLDPKL